MTARVPSRASGPARHERPDVDAVALVAARDADRLLAAAREMGARRWVDFFDSIPDRLRDDEVRELRRTALRVRAAYGPRDSIRDVLRPEVTEPLLGSVDRLLKVLARLETDAS
jgi:hypothetical protein